MKLKFLLLTSCGLLLLSSCGLFQRPAPDSERKHSHVGVDFEGDSGRERAPVKIGQGHLTGEYGPQPEGVSPSLVDQSSRQPVLAIVMAPALNRSLSYLGFLQELDEEGIRPNILVGGEFPSIIGAFWAKDTSPHRIEWEFFRLINQIGDNQVYSRQWRSSIAAMINEHFEGEKLESVNEKMIVPSYEWSQKRALYHSRGFFDEILPTQFLLNKDRRHSNKISLLEWSAIDPVAVREGGADIIIYLDALSPNIALNQADSYVLGAYLKAAGFLRNLSNVLAEDPFAVHIQIPMDGIALDQAQSLPAIVGSGGEQARKSLSVIEGLLEKWKNRGLD